MLSVNQVHFLWSMILLAWHLVGCVDGRHEFDVTVHDSGPLGLELSELLVVRGFVRGKLGDPPALQVHGGVEINDELVAVNSKVGVAPKENTLLCNRNSLNCLMLFLELVFS